MGEQVIPRARTGSGNEANTLEILTARRRLRWRPLGVLVAFHLVRISYAFVALFGVDVGFSTFVLGFSNFLGSPKDTDCKIV